MGEQGVKLVPHAGSGILVGGGFCACLGMVVRREEIGSGRDLRLDEGV